MRGVNGIVLVTAWIAVMFAIGGRAEYTRLGKFRRFHRADAEARPPARH